MSNDLILSLSDENTGQTMKNEDMQKVCIMGVEATLADSGWKQGRAAINVSYTMYSTYQNTSFGKSAADFVHTRLLFMIKG